MVIDTEKLDYGKNKYMENKIMWEVFAHKYSYSLSLLHNNEIKKSYIKNMEGDVIRFEKKLKYYEGQVVQAKKEVRKLLDENICRLEVAFGTDDMKYEK